PKNNPTATPEAVKERIPALRQDLLARGLDAGADTTPTCASKHRRYPQRPRHRHQRRHRRSPHRTHPRPHPHLPTKKRVNPHPWGFTRSRCPKTPHTVREGGVEPPRPYRAHGPEPCASAYSATRACGRTTTAEQG